jgi:Ni,Fe-hydrogenase III large subunit/Ni,Fe-hydrogenase III component G
MMQIPGIPLTLERLAAPLPIWRASCPAGDWSDVARAMAASGGRLVSLWGGERPAAAAAEYVVCAAYASDEGLLWLELVIDPRFNTYPDLTGHFPYASRMQRAIADLLGIFAKPMEDRRPWLNHGAWPSDYYPLRQPASGRKKLPDSPLQDYPFVRVDGDGVHEIAVGPVHAGIIEPGHFRFSVVGEKVLRLEERLGYKHKGIDQRFTELPASQGHRLAGRVSGDSTVAFAWAYCMALESLADTAIPARAQSLRALLLERERVANHLGDLGALANDAAFAFGLTQFMRLKEDWLRLNQRLFGHRLLMDVVIPGGIAVDLDPAGIGELLAQCQAIAGEVMKLRAIYDNHAGLQDRFVTTGRVTREQAARLGLTGLAGRASGIAHDLRADFALPPYAGHAVRQAGHLNGDVAARVSVRFDEIDEALRLICLFARELAAGEIVTPLARVGEMRCGAGWVEGWRGEVFVALESDGEQIRRCHCHDPSWQNWPVLEHAVIGNIVPDFPLINKSFNLSYAGHDR